MDSGNCGKCKVDLGVVYIECHECLKVKICPQCFTHGAEFGEHLKTHAYLVRDTASLNIFERDWTAVEEMTLLESIEQFGLGNWEEVAKNLPKKQARDIEIHYNRFYVDSIAGKLFIPAEIPNRMTDHTPPIHDSILSVPPPVVNVSKEDLMKLAYMPSRDDYEFEYDNEAENVLCQLDDDLAAGGDEHNKQLSSALVSIYLDRIHERQRRKDIAREYKLVEKFFTPKHLQEEASMKKYERELRRNLRSCSQFMKKVQFDNFIRDLLRERQLKRRIAHLRNCRSNGLTKLSECNAFEAWTFRKSKRKEGATATNGAAAAPGGTGTSGAVKGKTEAKMLSDTDEVQQQMTSSSNQRSDPLCKLLSASERQLCHSLKITPTRYFSYKAYAIKDNIKKKHEFSQQRNSANKPHHHHRSSNSSNLNHVHQQKIRHVTTFLRSQGWLAS